MKRILFALILLLFVCSAQSQNKYAVLEQKIDSLSSLGLPKSALAEIEKWDQLARTDGNTEQQIKATIARMIFFSYIREDALQEIINQLKLDIRNASFPVKPVLQSLLAEVYWRYYQQNRFNFANRTEQISPESDFSRWDLKTILSEVAALYQTSIADSDKLQKVSVSILGEAKTGDIRTRQFRPTLYDLLAHRALDFFLEEEADILKPKQAFNLNSVKFFAGNRDFVKEKLPTSDSSSNAFQGLQILKALTAYHIESGNKAAAGDLFLKRVEFVYRKSANPLKDSLYVRSLQAFTDDDSNGLGRADGLFQLARYYDARERLTEAMAYSERIISRFPATLAATNAQQLKKKLLKGELVITARLVNDIGKPLLLQAAYKNVSQIHYDLYQINEGMIRALNTDKRYNFNRRRISSSPQLSAYLARLKAFRSGDISIKDPKDYVTHRTEFLIESLPAGEYILLSSDAQKRDTLLNNAVQFDVSDLAYVSRMNPDGGFEIKTLSRGSGGPNAGVSVVLRTIEYSNGYEMGSEIARLTSDKDGVAMLPAAKLQNRQISLQLSKGRDTINIDTYLSGELERTDDDQARNSISFFTDRQLYRPGQTLYFKGMYLRRDKNGSKLLPQQDVKVVLLDANNKEHASATFKTNDFGTFNGTFNIPQNALNGNFRLSSADGVRNIAVEEYKRPSFEIELDPLKTAYKLGDTIRLKGRVVALSGYNLGGSRISYRVSRSSSWNHRYSVSEAEVASDTISTTGFGEFEVIFKASADEAGGSSKQGWRFNIQLDATDLSGETRSASKSVLAEQKSFTLAFPLPRRLLPQSDQLVIDNKSSVGTKNSPLYVVDGQVVSAITNIDPVNIESIDIKKGAEAVSLYGARGQNGVVLIKTKNGGGTAGSDPSGSRSSFMVPVTLRNMDLQKLSGTVKVKVYSLVSPTTPFYSRLFTAPDLPIIDKNEFEKLFPRYEYFHESDKGNWPIAQLVLERELKINRDSLNYLDLEFLKSKNSATYRIELLATNMEGDTLSLVNFTELIAEPSVPSSISNWVVPIKTNVYPGEEAEFYIGTGNPGYVFMELYNGAVKLKSEWIKTGSRQAALKIPVELNHKSLKVQMICLVDGQVLTSIFPIVVREKKANLSMSFATFRDKLQPGQKEQWKLQISGSEKNKAELLAGMYDASLDELLAPAGWMVDAGPGSSSYRTYFQWQLVYPLIVSSTYTNHNYYQGFNFTSRRYEQLNLFGYNYFGGYNYAYRSYLSQVESRVRSDKELELKYLRNSARVKEGKELSGIVVDKDNRPLPGVSVRIKNTSIGISSNSKGRFKIKVPKGAVLIFSFVGFITKELPASGKVSSVILEESANSLNEVAVVGYGTLKRKDLTGSVAVQEEFQGAAVTAPSALQGRMPGVDVQVRGGASILEDNAVYDFASIDSPPKNTVRTNFNETAFFYPNLYTNEKGEILINFTIPEALTRWKFRALAHTKDLKLGYIEKEVVTQKTLMASLNAPRFLREGDSINISARVVNLSKNTINGKLQLRLFNAVTMQELNLLDGKEGGNQSFRLTPSANSAITFKLNIPTGIEAITYRLTAEAGEFSDGEENTLPVFANSMLVTESMPFLVRPGQEKDLTFTNLVENKSTTLSHKALTLEYSENPAWYAVQALPYLMEFPYECSEQTFSRYFANSLASAIIAGQPKIKAIFERWKASESEALISNLEKNQELKNVLLEESPWLREAATETEQKRRISQLFDLNHMDNELQSNLDKLGRMQRIDGGFSWFAGGNYSDRYMSQHMLAGMGQLLKVEQVKRPDAFTSMYRKLLGYATKELNHDYSLATEYEKKHKIPLEQISYITLHNLYAHSYFSNQASNPNIKKALAYYLPKIVSRWKFASVYEQTLMAFVLYRNGDAKNASAIVRSLIERAQTSEELGMYWSGNALGFYWYQAPVETQALMIELFTELGGYEDRLSEMKIWLLRNKQTNNWKTTKATALACYALLLRGQNIVESNTGSEIILGGKPLTELVPETKKELGTGYLKATWSAKEIKSELGKVHLKNTGTVISWGALHWQYTEQMDNIKRAETPLKLERKYYIQTNSDRGPKLQIIDAAHTPKTGDVLKVVVYLNADREYEYIHLKDMRPSGTEPLDVLSGYKYQERFYYYQVTKDVATNFFINYLPKGKYVFEYSLRVVQPGNFSTGISSVQCLYAPEFNAHSEGSRLTVK